MNNEQQMLLCGAASIFGALFAGFSSETLFFQLFHEPGYHDLLLKQR
jgi:hypothetical protein